LAAVRTRCGKPRRLEPIASGTAEIFGMIFETEVAAVDCGINAIIAR